MTAAQWSALMANRSAPTAVYVWATWSRSSVELLPSILELEEEYAPFGVEFIYVSLDDTPAEALALMREVEGPPFYRLGMSLEEATGLLGIYEPPALLGYPTADGERLKVEPGLDEGFVATEDVAALLEELVREGL